MGKGRWIGVIAALTLLGTGTVARANKLVTITVPDRSGEIPQTWITYPGPPRANLLLPDNYDPARAYPLLVLLPGLSDDYNTFAENGIQQTLAGLDAIVVMPEGASGWYTDWWNNAERGGPAWESYELNEVLPQILATYKILPQRRDHAIAGISMGGLGAAYLGGRLPGYFGSVATLSGFVDPQLPTLADAVAEGEPATALAPMHGDDDLDAVEGPPDGFYATGHNPTSLVSNLAQTRVFESTGTGLPSDTTLSNPALGAVGIVLESTFIHPMNEAYHAALTAAGVNVTYQAHPGGHDVADVIPELKAMVAWGLFKPVVNHPRSWVNQTVATSGQLWDIGYHFTNPPTEVVKFRRRGNRLTVSAAGSPVTITTSRGCVLHTATPAQVTIAVKTCRHTAHHG